VSHASRIPGRRNWLRDERLKDVEEISTKRRKKMPLIQVRLIEDVFSAKQKNEIIEKLTDAMVSIEGENMRGVTLVTIEEVRSGDWGIGGKAMTTEAVKALAAGRSAA
jgi:4-oxalocrotonate tautomerase